MRRNRRVHFVEREGHARHCPWHLRDRHGDIEEIRVEGRAVTLCFPDPHPTRRDHFGPCAMVIHRPRVGNRIPEDSAVSSHDCHPRIGSVTQSLDERIDCRDPPSGFQRRRHRRPRHLCLGRKLLGQTIDVELATSNGEVDAKRHQHGDDQANLGQSEATTECTGQERCQDMGASRIRAAVGSGS